MYCTHGCKVEIEKEGKIEKVPAELVRFSVKKDRCPVCNKIYTWNMGRGKDNG